MYARQKTIPEEIQKAISEKNITAFEEILRTWKLDNDLKNRILFEIISSSKGQTDKEFVQCCLK